MEKKANVSHILSIFLILLELVWMQTSVFSGNISNIIIKILIFSKYIGTSFFVIYCLTLKRKKQFKEDMFFFFKKFLPIIIFYFVIEIICIIFGDMALMFGKSSFTRFLSIILDKICIFINAICICYSCKDDTPKVLAKALLIDEIIIILFVLSKYGFQYTIKSLFSFLGVFNSSSSIFEIHEATYCMGLLLIFFFTYRKEKNKNISVFSLLLLIIFFIIGEKRIGYLGVAAAIIFLLIVGNKKISKKFINIFCIVLCVASLSYVALLYNGKFMTYMKEHNINVMGRDKIYSYFIDRTSFSLDFKPWGLGTTSKILDNATKNDFGNMYLVSGMHNDFLKKYIEIGLIGFIIWIYFISKYLLEKFNEKFPNNSAIKFLMSIIIYSFITYLTDNTENYFMFQSILYCLTIYSFYFKKSN